jgi:hypothetical protein
LKIVKCKNYHTTLPFFTPIYISIIEGTEVIGAHADEFIETEITATDRLSSLISNYGSSLRIPDIEFSIPWWGL